MPCVLTVAGRHFDPELWLERVKLRAYRVLHVGDPLGGTRGRCKRAGFSVDVSRRGFEEFGRQLGDAKRFLRAHAAELCEMTGDPSVQRAVLDFGISSHVDGKRVFVQSVTVPADVVALAASCRLSLELSLYATDAPCEPRPDSVEEQ